MAYGQSPSPYPSYSPTPTPYPSTSPPPSPGVYGCPSPAYPSLWSEPSLVKTDLVLEDQTKHKTVNLEAPFQPRHMVEGLNIVWGFPAISSSYSPDASNPTTTTFTVSGLLAYSNSDETHVVNGHYNFVQVYSCINGNWVITSWEGTGEISGSRSEQFSNTVPGIGVIRTKRTGEALFTWEYGIDGPKLDNGEASARLDLTINELPTESNVARRTKLSKYEGTYTFDADKTARFTGSGNMADDNVTHNVSHNTYGSPVALVSRHVNVFAWNGNPRAQSIWDKLEKRYYPQSANITEEDITLEEMIDWYLGAPEVGKSTRTILETRTYLKDTANQFIMCSRQGYSKHLEGVINLDLPYNETLADCSGN